jgi:hypothetical protein
LVDRLDPFQANPLPLREDIVWVELVREAGTLIMLAAVGILAGRNRVSRLGYALLAFGVWDIGYYLFLRPMTGWPRSLWDWDILFLLPLPWWGPVLAPILIALLMILWGLRLTQFPVSPGRALSGGRLLGIGALGVLIALYVFMKDAIQVAPEGETILRQLLPTPFNWPLFSVALALMAAPLGPWLTRLRTRRTRSPEAGRLEPTPRQERSGDSSAGGHLKTTGQPS